MIYNVDMRGVSRDSILRSDHKQKQDRMDAWNRNQQKYLEKEAKKTLKAIRDNATESEEVKVSDKTYRNLTRL